MTAPLILGPYHGGEVPPSLTVIFDDSAGNPISLAGFTATFSYRSYGGPWVTRTAQVDADQVTNKGQTHYTWVAADFSVSGDFEAEMLVSGGSNQYYSRRLAWQTIPSVTADIPITVPPVNGHVTSLTVDNAPALIGGLPVRGRNVVVKTALYTASDGDYVLANAVGAAFTVNLPAATAGFAVVVKKTDTSINAVTVLPAAGTIDGVANYKVGLPLEAVTFVSDGANWFVLGVLDANGNFVAKSVTVVPPNGPYAPNANAGQAHVDSALVDNGLVVTTGPVTLPATSIADAALSANVALKNAGNAFTGANTFAAGQIQSFGTGDNVQYFVQGNPFLLDMRQGTSGSPILVGSGPSIKVSRTESIDVTTMPGGIGANNQGNAAIWASSTGDVNNQAQVASGVFSSITKSTQTRTATINPDAVGVQGLASVQGSGIGYAGGGYFHGRRDTATGFADGIEARISNFTASDGVYSAAAGSDTMGVWVTANGTGTNYPAVAVSVGRIGTSAFHVGYALTNNSVVDTSFRDDSSSTTSILINGTHTAALLVGATAGYSLFGGTSQLVAGTLLEVQAPQSSVSPLVLIGNTTGNFTWSLGIRNGSGSHLIGVAGATNSIITGSAAGDLVIQPGTASKRVLFGSSTLVLSIKNGNTLGFFGATESAQIAGGTDVLAGLVTHGLRAASSNPPLNLGTGTLTAGGLSVASGSVTLPAASVVDSYIGTDAWMPADYAFKSWAFDPALTVNGIALTPAGTVFVVRLHLREAQTITNVITFMNVAGATLTAGQCFAALFDSGKNLKSTTGDQSGAWVGATGVQTMALSAAQSMSAGDCYVAFFYNGTTGPTFLRAVASGVGNVGLSAANSRWATADTGRTTTMPATLGTFTGTSATYWAALS